MSRKKAGPSNPTARPTQPQIHEASLGPQGTVTKGRAISQADAETLRVAGSEVVVCGPDLAANRSLAQAIERNANGSVKRCPPHPGAGPRALPHYQPDPRPPEGHTFYETPHRKAT